MKTIKITALTKKGEKIIRIQKKTSPVEKATNKLFGIKEEIISESPLIIQVTIKKNMPQMVFNQIVPALKNRFFEEGADNNDFKIEIIEGN